MTKTTLIIELNEFSTPLLRFAASKMPLKNIERVLNFKETLTHTEDSYESGYLEPWVQWVSVHTGKPATEHKIMHLGDVPSREIPQVWEKLSAKGVTTGIWGAMNGDRKNSDKCLFFLPDPWTFCEPGYPAAVQDLLDLPRYFTKNRLSASKWILLKKGLRFLKVLWSSGALVRSIKYWPRWTWGVLRFGPKPFVQFSIFEHLSAFGFLHFKRVTQPQVSSIFLNLIAHAQHYYWTDGLNKLSPEMKFTLQVADDILGDLLDAAIPGQTTLVMNGLSQKNTNSEAPWIMYLQKRPLNFLNDIGVGSLRIDQLMTNDAHAFFKTAVERDRAYDRLKGLTVNGHRLLYVEKDQHDPLKLFYRLDFFSALPDDARLELDGQTFPFFEHFENVVVRTGKHVQSGVVFADGIELPRRLANHEINAHIFDGL